MSSSVRDPVLKATPIADLRPTQFTVGYLEVERKRMSWREKRTAEKSKTLESHMVPVVVGPRDVLYVTDHHHMLRALHDDGQADVFVVVTGDLHKADPQHFWTLMDYHGWTHPYDEKGRRRAYEELPRTVAGMRDDLYRSLAGALRNSGGFSKDSTPFSEFVWADFFRPRIKRKTLREDFEAALAEAYEIAQGRDADFLPGWCGAREHAVHPDILKKTAEAAKKAKSTGR
jgi:hypothetical protein